MCGLVSGWINLFCCWSMARRSDKYLLLSSAKAEQWHLQSPASQMASPCQSFPGQGSLGCTVHNKILTFIPFIPLKGSWSCLPVFPWIGWTPSSPCTECTINIFTRPSSGRWQLRNIFYELMTIVITIISGSVSQTWLLWFVISGPLFLPSSHPSSIQVWSLWKTFFINQQLPTPSLGWHTM